MTFTEVVKKKERERERERLTCHRLKKKKCSSATNGQEVVGTSNMERKKKNQSKLIIYLTQVYLILYFCRRNINVLFPLKFLSLKLLAINFHQNINLDQKLTSLKETSELCESM